ncbi:MAG TPA: redoxin domain-containing protein [Planctomycetota bacterium]|nr:redoxin domain-containing protein [Planctomycetota bacterium]
MAVIKVGDTAPDFTLKTQDNADWTLSAQKGKNVVLLWYPLDWSPTCEKENCAISNDKSLYGANRVVVGISRDSVWSHKAFKAERKIGHDLLADMMLETTKKFGLEHPGNPAISQRATVIVDKNGKVSFVQIQEKTGDPRDMKAVQDALAKLG